MVRTGAVFLREFWRSPRSIGAALPSSRALGKAMLAPIDFGRLHTLLELGPGTGAVTRLIGERLGARHRYLGIELNRTFHRRLAVEYPKLRFECGSVADLDEILRRHAIERVDAIVSGLPWASLPSSFQSGVFDSIARHLTPGGAFVTFAYLQGLLLPAARQLRRRLDATFTTVETTPIVWRNLPPAFAYVCRR